jgi:hypothetical protein
MIYKRFFVVGKQNLSFLGFFFPQFSENKLWIKWLDDPSIYHLCHVILIFSKKLWYPMNDDLELLTWQSRVSHRYYADAVTISDYPIKTNDWD